MSVAQQWLIGRDSPESLVLKIEEWAETSGANVAVCFDFFDTLVTRTVEPEYTKEMASHLLAKLLKYQFSGHQIYEHRRQIEADLCRLNHEINGELEFSYADLCGDLHKRLLAESSNSLITLDLEEFTQNMLAIELAVEKKVQEICPEVKQLLEGLNHAGFTLVLISDFYLPEAVFLKLIDHHQLSHFFQHIYVSTACGMSKGSGRIYPFLCKQLGITPSNVLMIGDNPHADITMAAEHGLHTLHVVRPANTSKLGTNRWKKDRLDGRRTSMFDEVDLPPQPFAEIGMSLWLFTHLLFQNLWERRSKDVFFLSKEGEFLKVLFEAYQREQFGQLLVRPHYLLASRKSTFIGSLRTLQKESFSRLLDHYRDLSIREFLQSLNLESDDIDSLCQSIDADTGSRRHELMHDAVFKALLKMESFQKIYEQKRQEQKQNFIAYLDSFGIDYGEDGITLVDVGWKGSIQDNIFHLLDGRVSVHGFYIGSLNATELTDKNTKKGLLFDNQFKPSRYMSVYNNNRTLFEVILGASHGSAEYYRAPESIEIDDEHDNFDASYAGISRFVKTNLLPEENRLYETVIRPLQQRILHLCSAMNLAAMIEQDVPSARWFAKHHARMVFLPTKEEINSFEKLYHLENFGIFEVTNFKTDHRFTLFERVVHLKNIIRNPSVLETGVWPPIILRRFGVGFWRFVDGRKRYRAAFTSTETDFPARIK